RRMKRAPTWVAVVLLVVGAVLLADQLGAPHADVVWGIGLIALGALLFWQGSGRGHREAAAFPAPPPPPYSPSGPPPPARVAPPPRPRPRPRSVLGSATVGIALVAVGIAAVLDNTGLFDMSLARYLALAVTILAGGLLV